VVLLDVVTAVAVVSTLKFCCCTNELQRSVYCVSLDFVPLMPFKLRILYSITSRHTTSFLMCFCRCYGPLCFVLLFSVVTVTKISWPPWWYWLAITEPTPPPVWCTVFLAFWPVFLGTVSWKTQPVIVISGLSTSFNRHRQ